MSIEIIYSILSVIVVSLVSLVGIFFLSLSRRVLDKVIFVLVSLSVGVLFGDVFVHILPELFHEAGVYASAIPVAVFVGTLTFFVLEKFFRWHHAHSISEDVDCVDCEVDASLSEHHSDDKSHIGNMVMFGDGLHNLIDGIVITASFMTSVPLGIATTIAVLFHEIPQEISDFGVLLYAGLSKTKAILYNLGTALVAVVGAVMFYNFGTNFANIIPLMIAFAAGNFIYLATADLIPELHHEDNPKRIFYHSLWLLAGVAIMYIAGQILPHGH